MIKTHYVIKKVEARFIRTVSNDILSLRLILCDFRNSTRLRCRLWLRRFITFLERCQVQGLDNSLHQL